MLRKLPALVACIGFACSRSTPPAAAPTPAPAPGVPAPTAKPAGTNALRGPVSFGFASAHGAKMDMKTAELAGNYFTNALGVPVEARIFTYDELTDAVVAGTVDVAFMPPLTYVKAARRAKLVLLRQSLHRGSPAYRSVVFVRKDSPIKSVEDLKGSTIAWIQSGSASGNLLPRAWLRARRIDLDSFFKEQLYLADHEKVCNAVVARRVDAGASFTDEKPDASMPTVVDGCRDSLGNEVEKLRIVFSTDAVPNDVLVVRDGAPAGLADKLSAAVDRLGSTADGKTLLQDGFQSDGFTKTSDIAFAALGKMLDASEEAK